MTDPFQFSIDSNDDVVYCIKIIGELRRGRALQNIQWLQAIAKAKDIAKEKVVIFDVSKLSYWDTEGIESVVGTVATINKAIPKRAGIIAPEDPHVTVLAQNRPVDPINTDIVPWKNSKSELITFLES